MLNLPMIMFRQLYHLFPRIIQFLSVLKNWAIALLLLVLCSSCFSPNTPEISLKLSVQSANHPGTYNVSGTTNLPDHSQITVSAIRYLFPTDGQRLGPDPNTTYSILDRQIAEVVKGNWQATLNLEQIAPDGRMQEAWQLNQSQTELSLNPSPEVSFLATFASFDQRSLSSNKDDKQTVAYLAQFQSPWQGKTQELRGSLVRFTSEGQPYVQVSQTLAIPLPVEKRAAPKIKLEDINGGWGNRSEIKPELPIPSNIRPQPLKTDQIDAPLSPSEFLR